MTFISANPWDGWGCITIRFVSGTFAADISLKAASLSNIAYRCGTPSDIDSKTWAFVKE